MSRQEVEIKDQKSKSFVWIGMIPTSSSKILSMLEASKSNSEILERFFEKNEQHVGSSSNFGSDSDSDSDKTVDYSLSDKDSKSNKPNKSEDSDAETAVVSPYKNDEEFSGYEPLRKKPRLEEPRPEDNRCLAFPG